MIFYVSRVHCSKQKWGSSTGAALKQPNAVILTGQEDETELSRQLRESAVDGPGMNGESGSNRRSGRNPKQLNAGMGGIMRSKMETGVDKSLEIRQLICTWCVSRTFLCHSCSRLLHLLRTWSSFAFFVFSLHPSWFSFFNLIFFSCLDGRNCVAWVDDEPV